MNMNKQTFNGLRVRVTHRCGHVEMQLSRSDAESITRKQVAAMHDCHNCIILQCRKDERAIKKATALRAVADPVSIRNAAIRRDNAAKLTERFNSLRTR